MPRTPKLFAGLSIANGLATLITAVVFAAGDYGAFRPQDSGAFRAIAGLLVAFAAIACLAFVGAAFRRNLVLIAGLSVVVAAANGVLALSPFHVPQSMHALTIVTSGLAFLAAVTEPPTVAFLGRSRSWPVRLMLLGSSAGGVALMGVGRYEFGPGDLDAQRAAGLAIAITGLTLFAVGTGAAVTGGLGRARFRPSLMVVSAATCFATIVVGVADLHREGVGRGSFAEVGNPWSGLFWLLLTATLVSAVILAGFHTMREPADHRLPTA